MKKEIEKPNHTCWHVPETSPCEACQWEADQIEINLKEKITSSEYQNLSKINKSRYVRFCGSKEVCYILNL